MKYTPTNLTNMSHFGTIKGISVMLMVDMEASRDKRFKLRHVDSKESAGWDFGDINTKCFQVLNNEISFDEAFSGFIQYTVSSDEFANILHDAFLEAFQKSKGNANDSNLFLSSSIQIINDCLDLHRALFSLPPRSQIEMLLEKNADIIFITGQSFSDWSSNFNKILNNK